MASFLIVYTTGQGQTAKIAEYIGMTLIERDHTATLIRATNPAPPSLADFDAVLVGSPINYQKHRPEIRAFIEAHRDELAVLPTALFQVSFASAIHARWASRGATELANDLIEQTGWHPDYVGLFPGAVTYTKYPFFQRLFFKLFSAVTTGDTDTSRDYEYTDWEDVAAYATEFAAFVAGRVSAPTAGEQDATAARSTAASANRWSAATKLGLFALALIGLWLAVGRYSSRQC